MAERTECTVPLPHMSISRIYSDTSDIERTKRMKNILYGYAMSPLSYSIPVTAYT